MHYAGSDYHKRYSVVIIQNEQGQIVQERRVDPAYPEGFRRLFRECPEPVSVVYESTVNCSWRYEILQPLKRISGSSGFSVLRLFLGTLSPKIKKREEAVQGKADRALPAARHFWT
jgi:hypothetical protein